MGPDPVCPERFDPDPDPVCPERLDLDPDPVNIRPDPKPWSRAVHSIHYPANQSFSISSSL